MCFSSLSIKNSTKRLTITKTPIFGIITVRPSAIRRTKYLYIVTVYNLPRLLTICCSSIICLKMNNTFLYRFLK